MAEKQKSYNIKVPVYTTEIIESTNDLFGITYAEMITAIKSKIDNFQSELSFENRNKTKKNVIYKIEYTEQNIGDVPSLLLQIFAYSTNLYDGYFEAEEKITFQKENKIGSDTNFILLYPVINGLSQNNYIRYFLVLVYEDPNKDSGEITKISKNVVNKILNIPIQNIKLPTILDELKSISTIPELQVRYFGINNADNEVDVKYREYLQCGKIKKTKENSFKNMPFDTLHSLLDETDETGEYQRKETKLVVGKKEYRISKELFNEASESLKETAEKIFNATTSVTQDELEKIYHTDFMIEKLSAVLQNYLTTETNGNGNFYHK
jgi:hypothetical protein